MISVCAILPLVSNAAIVLSKDMSTTIHVRVTPRAAQNKITEETNADGEKLYRVYITTVPEDGKANKEVIKMMAKYLGIPKSSLTLIRGEKNRDKIFEINAE